jgi:hypothetical protein
MAGELILLHNLMREKNIISLNKYIFRWLKLYCVVKINSEMESYVLAEINRAELNETVAENRLKRFFSKSKKFIITALKIKHAT